MAVNPIQASFETAYADRAPVFGTVPADYVREAAELLPQGADVLDLGCGDGRNSLYLLERGFNVSAVDFSPSGIGYLKAEAEKRGFDDKLTAAVADVRAMDAPAEFDAVMAITVLENLHINETLTLLERIKAATRVGGLVVVESYSDRDPIANGKVDISEFGHTIVDPLMPNELLTPFLEDWRVLHYRDIIWEDTTHGLVHTHGWLGIIAQREA